MDKSWPPCDFCGVRCNRFIPITHKILSFDELGNVIDDKKTATVLKCLDCEKNKLEGS